MENSRISRISQSFSTERRFEHDFEKHGEIGQGGFSKVYKAKRLLDGRSYAVKVLTIKKFGPNFQSEFDHIRKEILLLAGMQSEHIVNYYNSWTEIRLKQPVLVDSPAVSNILSHERNESGICTNDKKASEAESSVSSLDLNEDNDNSFVLEFVGHEDQSVGLGGQLVGLDTKEKNQCKCANQNSINDRNKCKSNCRYNMTESKNKIEKIIVDFKEYDPKAVQSLDIFIQMELCQETLSDYLARQAKSWDKSPIKETYLKNRKNTKPEKPISRVYPRINTKLKNRSKSFLAWNDLETSLQSDLPTPLQPDLALNRKILSEQATLQQPSLRQFIEEFYDKIKIFEKIIKCVEWMHSNNLIHRDIKPSNIFITRENKIKIGDFGLAKSLFSSVGESNSSYSKSPLSNGSLRNLMVCSSIPLPISQANDPFEKNSRLFHQSSETSELNGFCHTKNLGTPQYAAPEQLENSNYNQKVDIYSLGLVLLELLHPMQTIMEKRDKFDRVKEKGVLPDVFQSCKEYVVSAELIRKMVDRNPDNRPDIFQVRDFIILNFSEDEYSGLKRGSDNKGCEGDRLGCKHESVSKSDLVSRGLAKSTNSDYFQNSVGNANCNIGNPSNSIIPTARTTPITPIITTTPITAMNPKTIKTFEMVMRVNQNTCLSTPDETHLNSWRKIWVKQTNNKLLLYKTQSSKKANMILHLDECIIEGNFIEERRREQPKGRWSSCGRFPVVSPVGGLTQGNKLRIRISTPSVSASVPAQNSLVRSSTVQGKCRSIEERMIEDEENEDCNFRFDQSIKSLSSVKFVDKRLSGGLGLWDRGIEGSPFGFSRGDRMGVWDGLDYRDCKEGKESKETKEGGDCKESSTRRSEPENYNETRNLHLKAKDHTEISNNPSKQTSNTKSTPQLNSPSNPPNQLTKPTTKPQISQMAHKTSSLTYSNPFTLSRPNEKILTTPQFSIPREDPQFANVTISELSLASEHEDLENPPLLTTQDPRDCQIPTILKSALSKKRNRLLTRHPSLNSLGTLNYRIEIDHPDLPQYCLKAKDLFDSYEFYQSVLGSLC